MSPYTWQHRSGSTFAQVMACCLTAPNPYLKQCWLPISKVLWHSPQSNFTVSFYSVWVWNLYLWNYCHTSQGSVSQCPTCFLVEPRCRISIPFVKLQPPLSVLCRLWACHTNIMKSLRWDHDLVECEPCWVKTSSVGWSVKKMMNTRGKKWDFDLTHCGLVMPYSNADLGQH